MRLPPAGRVKASLLGALGLFVAADLAAWAAGALHGHTALESLPLFGLLAGFVGALAIAWVAKFLAHALLERPEGDHG